MSFLFAFLYGHETRFETIPRSEAAASIFSNLRSLILYNSHSFLIIDLYLALLDPPDLWWKELPTSEAAAEMPAHGTALADDGEDLVAVQATAVETKRGPEVKA